MVRPVYPLGRLARPKRAIGALSLLDRLIANGRRFVAMIDVTPNSFTAEPALAPPLSSTTQCLCG